MSGATLLIPLYSFMACTWATLPLSLLSLIVIIRLTLLSTPMVASMSLGMLQSNYNGQQGKSNGK